MSNSTDRTPTKGFAILIKAPGATRHFVPREGETITITDKDGKQLWSFRVPVPIDDPGVIIHEVQIDLLTEREFGYFCQKTWTGTPAPKPNLPPPPTNAD
jgi:hypothetical protein